MTPEVLDGSNSYEWSIEFAQGFSSERGPFLGAAPDCLQSGPGAHCYRLAGTDLAAFPPGLHPRYLFRFLGLAGLANIFYSVAYVIDLPLQFTSIRNVWQRRRWILWTIGMLFAILITFYWIADEIYPYVNVSSG
jgi:hypothetical protein